MATTSNIHRADNTPPPPFEQLKRVVREIPKYWNRPETIRVSLLPLRGHVYIDVRVYLAGKPTRKGIALHRDLVPRVLGALQQALRSSWDQLPKEWEEESLPMRGQPSVHWPEGL